MKIAGTPARDFVVRYAPNASTVKPTIQNVYLASHEAPFTVTKDESLAARFGQSFAASLVESYPFIDNQHGHAEVVSVPRITSMI